MGTMRKTKAYAMAEQLLAEDVAAEKEVAKKGAGAAIHVSVSPRARRKTEDQAEGQNVEQSFDRNAALWAAQGALASIFLSAGFVKAFKPIATVRKSLPWTEDLPAWAIRSIGVCELAGAAGMILPKALNVKPKLTPIAGLCLATNMIGASTLHVKRNEPKMIATNLALAALASFVAVGRLSEEESED